MEKRQKFTQRQKMGTWHSEILIKSSLIYSISYSNLEELSPPMLPCDNGTV